jgi:hypothetical protein
MRNHLPDHLPARPQPRRRVARPIVLSGPAAAQLYGLDGFRDSLWPHSYATPLNGNGGPRIIRTRQWGEPVMLERQFVAPVATVLRHLNAFPKFLVDHPDEISPQNRVELATEHARRLGAAVSVPHNARGSGDQLLRQVRRLSGSEPPTESYAETVALQWFRRIGYQPFRQLEIHIGGKTYRSDFGISLGPKFRPEVPRPDQVLLCELDSRGFHQHTLEQDTERRNAFARAGFHHVELMPNEIRNKPQRALATLEGAIRRTGRTRQPDVSLTPRPK